MIEELDAVVLTRDLPKEQLAAGDVGTLLVSPATGMADL
jgi:hypothetical protein